MTLTKHEERVITKELGEPICFVGDSSERGKIQIDVLTAKKIVNSLIAKKNYRVYKDDNQLLLKSFLKLNDNKKLWDKFRLIVPKFTGALHKLQRDDNTFTEDPLELDKLVRSGREFWLEPVTRTDFQETIHDYKTLQERKKIEALQSHDKKENQSHGRVTPPNLILTTPLAINRDEHSTEKQSHGRVALKNPAFGTPPTPSSSSSVHENKYRPTFEHFLKAILASADSAPGIDNIPYAYYRANPAQQAERLQNKLQKILQGLQPPPKQLLVWIPKAEAGYKSDNWRPLSMPVTWDRLIDQAVYAAILPFFESKLDHAQSLISKFKDPQHNYLAALKLLESATPTNKTYVMLMDLMKAFEKIETAWILTVLSAIDAPEWFISYTKWVLHKDRNATPRIKQTLLQPLNLKRGIDMGRACSVLLFCCAIDPFISLMPKIEVKRAYMDDTTLGDRNLAEIKLIQTLFESFQGTGLQTLRHDCCKARITKNEGLPQIIQTSSWAETMKLVTQSPNTKVELWNDNWIQVSRATVRKLKNQVPDPKLDKLFTAKCSCKCKTTLICSSTPTSQELRYIDNMPFGAKIISTEDVTLGLILHNKTILQTVPSKPPNKKTGEVQRRILTVKRKSAVKLRTKKYSINIETWYKRALASISKRAHALKRTITPISDKGRFFHSYCSSTLLYVATVRKPTKLFLHKAKVAFSKATLTRPFIHSDHAQVILAQTKIVPGLDLAINIEAQTLGLGLKHALGFGTPPSTLKQRITSLIEKWNTIREESGKEKVHPLKEILENRTQTTGVGRSNTNQPPGKGIACIQRIVKDFKTDMISTQQKVAENYLFNKVNKLEWIDPHIFLHNYAHLAKIKNQQANPNDKLTWLKWMTGEESDSLFWQRTKNHTRKGLCKCGCGRLSSIWLGNESFLSCEHLEVASHSWLLEVHKNAISEAQKYAILTNNDKLTKLLEQLQAEKQPKDEDTSLVEELDLDSSLPFYSQAKPCPFCRQNVATTQHWMISCPVTLLFFSIIFEEVVQCTDIMSKRCTAARTAKTAKAMHTLHRVALARGAIGAENSILLPAKTQSAALKQLLEEHTHRPANAQLKCPCINETNIMRSEPDFLPTIPTFNNQKTRQLLCNKQGTKEGDILATTNNLDSLRNDLLLNALNQIRRSKDCCECYFKETTCSCGNKVHQLISKTSTSSTKPLILDEALYAKKSSLLVGQFDGSFLQSKGEYAAGAGIILWEFSDASCPKVIEWKGVELPSATDSAEAEAAALSLVTKEIARACAERHYDQFLIQGDNQAIVYFLAGEFKLKSIAVFKQLEEAWNLRAQKLPNLIFEHIPRESNKFTDHAAGLAARSLLDKRISKKHQALTATSNLGDSITLYLPLPVLEIEPQVFLHLQNNTFQLVEICQQPHPKTWHLLSSKYQHKPEKLAVLKTFLNFLQLKVLPNEDKHGYIAGYKPSVQEPQGRIYATAVTAQRLSKDFRCLLFHDHFEIDLTLAHMNILLRDRVERHDSQLTIHQLKTQLEQMLEGTLYNARHPNAMKRLIYKILNTTAAESIKDLYATDIVPPTALLSLIRELDRLKQGFLLDYAEQHIPIHHNNRNTFFFIITKQERELVQRLSLALTNSMRVESIIWLHDGVWVYPAPCEKVLQAVANAAVPNEQDAFHLFRYAPVINYINCEPHLKSIHEALQHTNTENKEIQSRNGWSKNVIKDSINKETRSKLVRDLTIQNKTAVLRITATAGARSLHDFFKKKGLHT